MKLFIERIFEDSLGQIFFVNRKSSTKPRPLEQDYDSLWIRNYQMASMGCYDCKVILDFRMMHKQPTDTIRCLTDYSKFYTEFRRNYWRTELANRNPRDKLIIVEVTMLEGNILNFKFGRFNIEHKNMEFWMDIKLKNDYDYGDLCQNYRAVVQKPRWVLVEELVKPADKPDANPST